MPLRQPTRRSPSRRPLASRVPVGAHESPPKRHIMFTPLPSPLAYLVIIVFALGTALHVRTMATAALDVGSLDQPSNTRPYMNQEQGYRLRYPADWTAVPLLHSESVLFVNNTDHVMVTTKDEASDSSLFPDATVSYVLHGAPATRYHDVDPVTGEAIDRLVVKRPDGRVTEIKGVGSAFDIIVLSFRLLSPQP